VRAAARPLNLQQPPSARTTSAAAAPPAPVVAVPAPPQQRPQRQQPRPDFFIAHAPSLAHARAVLAGCALLWAAAVGAGVFLAASPRFDTGRHAAPGGLLLWFDRALRVAGPALVVPALSARLLAGWLRAGPRPTHHHPLAVRSAARAGAVYAAAAGVRLGMYAPHQAGFLGAGVEAVRGLAAQPAAVLVEGVVERARAAATALASTHPAASFHAAVGAAKAAYASAADAAARHAGTHVMSDHLLLGACAAALLAGEAGVLGAEALAHRARAAAGRPPAGRAHALALHVGLALAIVAYLALAADMAVTAAHFHEPFESLLAAGLGALVFQLPLAAWLVQTWPRGRRGRGEGEARRRRKGWKKGRGGGGGS
jgi:hypothetical protein